ncbi:uncharacterized protein LOC126836879 [Adelges cooleyi]|uniref:uncharacterized protein LOC126836879 n=1 Tax=Adelges cooleyi TaxID=133065 RepID=UPI00217FFEB3|nr:uncharacterized protein LOC126836879 [Adelges cooleyi]
MDKLKELCKDDEDKFLAMRDELSSKIASEDPAVISEIMNNVNMRLRNYNDQLGYESEGEIVFRGMNPVSPQKDDPYKKEKVSVASVIAELEKNPSEDELDKINEKLVQYINDLLHKIEKTEVHDNPTASVSADTAATDDDNLDKPVAAKNEQLNAPVKKKIRNKISSLFHVHKKDHNKE